MRPLCSFLLLTLMLLRDASAIWPFPTKRFTTNGFIDAKTLGLEDTERVIAFGDFDGDQFLDVVGLNKEQNVLTLYIWNHDTFTFSKNLTLQSPEPIINVVPGDFTRDGKLDLLLMSQSSSSSSKLDLSLRVGSVQTGFEPVSVSVPPASLAQPLTVDFDGNLRIDLLGHASGGNRSLQVWKNVWESSNRTTLFEMTEAGMSSMSCQIANPHSNAVVDFDGDCLADLFLVCEDPTTNKLSFQIWLNDKAKGFTFKQTDDLPAGSGKITFADIDRDGTMDMVFPTCESVSRDGVGRNCAINIAFNKQRPLCTSSSSNSGRDNCRRPDDLCIADPQFHFDLRDVPSNDAFVKIPLSNIIPNMSSFLMTDTSFTPAIPLGIGLGDANLDGYPDLLTVVAAGDSKTTRLIWSVDCQPGIPGCGAEGKGRRGFVLADGQGLDVLESFKDVRGASFLDMDEDGTLDILVQRTGSQGQGTINFVQNNVFHDAFFLKAIVLNGACGGICVPLNDSEPSYHPFGVSYSGATYKYTILDTTGKRSAAQVAQLAQTSYHALQTPYSFFGLGRTNNYIENLFVGSTKRDKEHYINMEGVIPNSRVVIRPANVGRGASEWKRELYLRPGEWIPWVTVTLVVATVVLGIVVGIFHFNEKREDEAERRRALHHINFDAL